MIASPEFLAALPKSELHVHHVGSVSAVTLGALAERYPGTVPTDPDALAQYFTFTDFAHFIEVYLSVVDLVRDADDVHLLTSQVLADLTAQQVRYAEVTVTPYTSVNRSNTGTGIAPEAFIEAIEDARTVAERDLGIRARWIFDIPGEAGIPAADETLRIALEHGPSSLLGFGLGGPEVGVPRPQFKPHFEAARAAGLHSVPHAGETTGPQTIWDALNELGAERIGHGTSAVQDPELVRHLAERQIPLEVSLTSNLATRAVTDLAEHPIRALVEAGVVVTLNSDDPPMFGTTLTREYELAAELLDLDQAGAAELARTAVRCSFLPAADQEPLLAEIDQYQAEVALH